MMSQKDQIDQVFVKLDSNGQTFLSLMLSRQGGINRMGDGSGDQKYLRFFMGNTDPGPFHEFLAELDEGLLAMAGRYVLPDPKGELCILTISFVGKGLDTGFQFTYGSESDGPPEEILSLMDLLVGLSDPWYADQLAKNKRN